MLNKEHEIIIKSINKDYQIIERFAGGMSNYTYKIIDNNLNKLLVFRIKGENGERFVDYFIEKQNLEIINQLNINSKTIFTNPEKGIKVAEYIEGNNIEKPNYLKISIILKKLHNSNIKLVNDYSHLQRLEKYEKFHNNKSTEYLKLKKEFIDIFNTKLINFCNFPCHNDAQINNFIEDNTKNYHLLDWEFAGRNDYIYDIASFGNKDFNDAINLLNVYIENPNKSDYFRLYNWRFFQCLQWFNVANAKHEAGLSSKLNIPFDKVADNYIILAKKMYDKGQEYK